MESNCCVDKESGERTTVRRSFTGPMAALMLLLFSCLGLFGQTGILDTTFSSGTGPNAMVDYMDATSDGKLVIAGAFTSYDGAVRRHIALVNSDGTLDESFDPGDSASNMLVARGVLLLSDGKVLLCGLMNRNGVFGDQIIRLTTGGNIDTSFDAPFTEGSQFFSMAIQPDGKVLVGGAFNLSGYPDYPNLIRLNADGSVDSSFASTVGADGTVNSVAVGSDGFIWIGGEFQTIHGQFRAHLARLSADGELDMAFQSSDWVAPVTMVKATILQKIVVAAQDQLEVYDEGGSLASGLESLSVVGYLSDAITQEDGKLIIVGDINVPAQNIVRFNADGSFDQDYGSAGRPIPGVAAVRALSGGRILIAGAFQIIGNQVSKSVARLFGDQTTTTIPTIRRQPTDLSVMIGQSASLSVTAVGYPLAIQWYKDDHAIGGATSANLPIFSDPTSMGTYYVEVSNELGIATSESVQVSVKGDDVAITQQPPGMTLIETQPLNLTVGASGSEPISYQWRRDGSAIVGGDQSSFTIARTDPSESGSYSVVVSNPWSSVTSDVALVNILVAPSNPGALNVSRTAPANPPSVRVSSVKLMEDGRLLVQGTRELDTGGFVSYIGKLRPDGAPDPGFVPALGPNDTTASVVGVLPNGNLLVAVWRQFNVGPGEAGYDLFMLAPNGAKISGFQVPGGMDGLASRAVVQSTGKIVVIGRFQTIGDLSRTNIARLNSDGSADSTFAAPYNQYTTPSALVVLPDDRLYFAEWGSGTAPPRLVTRLSVDGLRDSTFNPIAEGFPPPHASTLYALPDGRILVGGSFSKVNGQVQNNLVLLKSDGSIDSTFNIGSGPDLDVYEIQPLRNGSFLICGRFISINGVDRPLIARLDFAGSIDPAFYLPTLPSDSLGSIDSVTPMVGGDVVITTGDQVLEGFVMYYGLAVLHGDSLTAPTIMELISQRSFLPDNKFQLQLSGTPGHNYRLQRSADFSVWTDLLDYTATTSPQSYEDPSSTKTGFRFYRTIPQP